MANATIITAAEFKRRTGREPEQDDLERVNCPEAGAIGHLCCGWNVEAGKPQFEVGALEWNGRFPRSLSAS